MALGTNNTTAAVAGNFIPELWSDEVIGSYKSNLVLANLVTKLSHKGKKGDTIHIPKPNRGSASAKAANTQVTLSAATNSVINISIDKHYEYSKLIEDIAEVQALASMRKFYTEDAGYALAKQVDDDLFTAAQVLNGGTIVSGSTGTDITNNAAITDAGIRKMILTLDDADVPMDGRSIIVPPICASTLLGIDRFTEQQFIGSGDAIKTGKIGMIYGVEVFISSNCPTLAASDASADTDRVGILLHKDALVLAEQVGVRTQTQYKQEYLGDLFTADTIYGVGELRDDAGVPFAVPGV
jgi:N4-gp56 family major capsid protein